VGHPDDQPKGNIGSLRSDGAVTSHDVARMSDADLLTLYQGLFAQSFAGQHPDTYDVHGPSLQELAEGDELSRAGNEPARRCDERGGAFATSFSAGHPHDSSLTATTKCCTITPPLVQIFCPLITRGVIFEGQAESFLLPHFLEASCCPPDLGPYLISTICAKRELHHYE
jgi:hypothetical protein